MTTYNCALPESNYEMLSSSALSNFRYIDKLGIDLIENSTHNRLQFEAPDACDAFTLLNWNIGDCTSKERNEWFNKSIEETMVSLILLQESYCKTQGPSSRNNIEDVTDRLYNVSLQPEQKGQGRCNAILFKESIFKDKGTINWLQSFNENYEVQRYKKFEQLFEQIKSCYRETSFKEFGQKRIQEFEHRSHAKLLMHKSTKSLILCVTFHNQRYHNENMFLSLLHFACDMCDLKKWNLIIGFDANLDILKLDCEKLPEKFIVINSESIDETRPETIDGLGFYCPDDFTPYISLRNMHRWHAKKQEDQAIKLEIPDNIKFLNHPAIYCDAFIKKWIKHDESYQTNQRKMLPIKELEKTYSKKFLVYRDQVSQIYALTPFVKTSSNKE